MFYLVFGRFARCVYVCVGDLITWLLAWTVWLCGCGALGLIGLVFCVAVCSRFTLLWWFVCLGVLLAFTLILLVVYGVAGLCLTVGFVGWVWYVWLVNSVVVF